MKLIINMSNSNLDSIYFTKKITVNPKLKHMIIKCSNPLLKNKKECVALWNELNNFNKQIDTMEYNINNLDIKQTNNFIFDKACTDESTEECRVYED